MEFSFSFSFNIHLPYYSLKSWKRRYVNSNKESDIYMSEPAKRLHLSCVEKCCEQR
jgi:hypothetical protein